MNIPISFTPFTFNNIKTSFNQSYSKGFIELYGLQTVMYNNLKDAEKAAKEKKPKTKKS